MKNDSHEPVDAQASGRVVMATVATIKNRVRSRFLEISRILIMGEASVRDGNATSWSILRKRPKIRKKNTFLKDLGAKGNGTGFGEGYGLTSNAEWFYREGRASS